MELDGQYYGSVLTISPSFLFLFFPEFNRETRAGAAIRRRRLPEPPINPLSAKYLFHDHKSVYSGLH